MRRAPLLLRGLIAAFAAQADGPHSLRLYAIRRGPAALGGAVYEAIVVHRLGMLFQLASPARAPAGPPAPDR